MKTITKRFDLIISDIGGVLIRTEEAIFDLIEQIAIKKKIQKSSRENMLNAIGTKVESYIYNYLPDKHKDKTKECHKEFKKSFPDKVNKQLTVFPGTEETLSFIKNHKIKIAVISCLQKRAINKCLSKLAFKKFDYIKPYFERPNPIRIRELVNMFDVSSRRTLYIGDAPADIQMGKRAQVVTVAVMSGAVGRHKPEMLTKECPDYLIDSFRDLPGIIFRKEELDG
ncbi:MAG: HAD family hydrolase [Sedimentisphaerales bacterium]|nr:HAD family hydrolase [Sedimentisphaerales bacterium]